MVAQHEKAAELWRFLEQCSHQLARLQRMAHDPVARSGLRTSGNVVRRHRKIMPEPLRAIIFLRLSWQCEVWSCVESFRGDDLSSQDFRSSITRQERLVVGVNNKLLPLLFSSKGHYI